MGSEDKIFKSEHIELFHEALCNQGIQGCKKEIVKGKNHAFDMWCEIGDEVDREVVWPAARWLAGWVERKTDDDLKGDEGTEVEEVESLEGSWVEDQSGDNGRDMGLGF